MQLKIMTFNIRHGRGMDGEVNLSRIANLIRENAADIIGLNEVDRHFSERSDFIDQAAWLADCLQMDYAYGPAISLDPKTSTTQRQYGNALLSRYPIASINNYRFHFGVVEDRSLLETTVLINEQPFQAFVTHLSLDPLTHKKQTNFILDQVKQDENPVVLLGDWNMKPGSRAWRRITRHLTDAWDCAGEGAGFTFPSLRPRVRLDYIFLNRHFHIENVEVITTVPEASDHLPLVTKVNTHFR